MIGGSVRSVIWGDLFVGTMAIIAGALSAVGVRITADQWWIGVAATALTAALMAASDRSRTGLWVLVGVGMLAMAGIVWSAASDGIPRAILPLGMIGLGAGTVLNRLVFGVVRSVPDARLARQGGLGGSQS
ncbi:hypothetical protein [Halosimplex sp. J119]